VERYRQSVLKAAVTGELTRDWREEHEGELESGETLVARILEARRRAWETSERDKMKAKSLRPATDEWRRKYKQAPVPQTTGLKDLPKGWIWTSLDQVSERITDGTHQPPPFTSKGIPFLTIEHVTPGKIAWDELRKWVSEETFLKFTRSLRPSKGDVLYSAVGSYGMAVAVTTELSFMFQRHIAHRGGKKYPRYWCPNSACLAVKVSKAKLEGEFLELLGRLKPKPDVVADFRKVAAKVWGDRQGDSEREIRDLVTRLDDRTRLKSELLKMRARGELTLEEFEQAKAELAVETYQIEEQIQMVKSRQTTADAFGRFAEVQLTNIANVWDMAAPEQQQRVQNLLFEDGLAYSQDKGILNRSNSSLFNVLETMNSEKGWLVGPPGLEPGANGL